MICLLKPSEALRILSQSLSALVAGGKKNRTFAACIGRIAVELKVIEMPRSRWLSFICLLQAFEAFDKTVLSNNGEP